jgi:putative resolvase
LYGRVSGHGQKEDLARQLTTLHTWAKEHHPQSEIIEIKEVGSGLNTGRKGLARLLSLVQQRQARQVVVTYKERLTRFGFEYIEMFCNSYGVEIVILNQQEETTPEQELVDDLIALVTSFAGRLYGLRSGKVNEVVQCLKKVTSP